MKGQNITGKPDERTAGCLTAVEAKRQLYRMHTVDREQRFWFLHVATQTSKTAFSATVSSLDSDLAALAGGYVVEADPARCSSPISRQPGAAALLTHACRDRDAAGSRKTCRNSSTARAPSQHTHPKLRTYLRFYLLSSGPRFCGRGANEP